MTQRLSQLISTTAPSFVMIMATLMFSLVQTIPQTTIIATTLLSILFLALQIFVLKKKPQKLSAMGSSLMLFSAICAVYLMVPLTEEEKIFGIIMYSGFLLLFIYQLFHLFFKK